ncbi:MAG: hypothetical protein L6R36_007379, partial [Xanthoria steineri]
MGQHMASFETVQIVSTLKWSWIAQILNLIADTGGRLEAMAYLTTVQGPTQPRAKAGFLGTLCIVQVASVIAIVAMILAQCSPIMKLWDEGHPGTCNGRTRNRDFGYFQGGLSALTDLCLIIYPVLIFWTLKLKIMKKVVLSFLFGCGSFRITAFVRAAVCTIVKAVQVQQIGTSHDVT